MSRRRSPFLLGLVGSSSFRALPRLPRRRRVPLVWSCAPPRPAWRSRGTVLGRSGSTSASRSRRSTHRSSSRCDAIRTTSRSLAGVPSARRHPARGAAVRDPRGPDRSGSVPPHRSISGRLARPEPPIRRCPGGHQSERVDGSGPFDPAYPAGCGFNADARRRLGDGRGVEQPATALERERPPAQRSLHREGVHHVPLPDALRYRPEDAAVRIAIRIRRRSGCDF